MNLIDFLNKNNIGYQINSDNLTIGGYLYLRGTSIKLHKEINRPPEGFAASVKLLIELRFNAKGYTIADGILARIINKRGKLYG